MSAPLISDATFAKIVRLVSLDNDSLPDVSSGDCMRLIRCLTQDRPADALDWARRDGFSAGLLRLLEEANEEASRAYDERERRDSSADHTRLADAVFASIPPRPGVRVDRITDGVRFTAVDVLASRVVGVAVDDSTPQPDGTHPVTVVLPSGPAWDADGKSPLQDLEELMKVAAPTYDEIITSPEVALRLARATLERITKERDEARAELAATKKKLQGVLYGKRRRS